MQFKVTQENLSKALAHVSRVAATRTALPILSNVLLRAEKGRILLSATNLDIAVTQTIAGKVEETGEITVPARLTNDFVSSLPEGNIDVVLEENKVHIQSGQFKSNINGTPTEDFPSLPSMSANNSFSLSAEELKKALSQVVFAASNDEARQVLTGVYLHTFEKKAYLVATDSYRLAEKRLSVTDLPDSNLLIPATALQDLLRIISDGDDEVEVQYDESQVQFTYGDIQLTSRLVDGNYPDYRQLIPKDNQINFTINKKDFIDITKVSSLFARESAGSITLQVSEDDQEISIQSIASQVGDNTSKAKAKVEGSGNVTLNSRYLLDALQAVDADEVTFSFNGKINPCVMRPANDKNTDYQHIVMPLRS